MSIQSQEWVINNEFLRKTMKNVWNHRDIKDAFKDLRQFLATEHF